MRLSGTLRIAIINNIPIAFARFRLWLLDKNDRNEAFQLAVESGNIDVLKSLPRNPVEQTALACQNDYSLVRRAAETRDGPAVVAFLSSQSPDPLQQIQISQAGWNPTAQDFTPTAIDLDVVEIDANRNSSSNRNDDPRLFRLINVARTETGTETGTPNLTPTPTPTTGAGVGLETPIARTASVATSGAMIGSRVKPKRSSVLPLDDNSGVAFSKTRSNTVNTIDDMVGGETKARTASVATSGPIGSRAARPRKASVVPLDDTVAEPTNSQSNPSIATGAGVGDETRTRTDAAPTQVAATEQPNPNMQANANASQSLVARICGWFGRRQ